MMHRSLVVLSLIALQMFSGATLATSTAQTTAVMEADRWVQSVDDGFYFESWREASTHFKKVITAEQWAEAVGSVRDRLGTIASRKMSSATYTTSLPNAPSGEYVVIQYTSIFAKQTQVVETLTVVHEHDKWKAAGYFVK